MEIGMLHLHVTVVTLFLILLLFKTIVLLANKTAFLDKVRAKTKIVDMVLGFLILATGIYLLTITGEIETYLLIKIVLVVIAIPLGIVGIKKGNKALAVIATLMFIYIYGIAETKSYKFKRDDFELTAHKSVLGDEAVENILQHNIDARMQDGKIIYKVLCVECHGEDGKKGLFNATDLTQSQMSDEERFKIISEGKGAMRGYGEELSEDEIKMVSAYVETLGLVTNN